MKGNLKEFSADLRYFLIQSFGSPSWMEKIGGVVRKESTYRIKFDGQSVVIKPIQAIREWHFYREQSDF